MAKLRRPQFLPGFLAICLTIGVIANLYTKKALFTGVVVLLGAALLLSICHFLAPKLDALPKAQVGHGLFAAGGAMLLGQLAILKWLPVTVYHDPYRVLSQADQMAAGHNLWAITYFWRYPNNVPLAYLLSLWLRFTNLFGLSTNTSIHLLSLIVLDGFIALLLVMVRRFAKRNAPVIGAASFMLLTPFAYTYYLQVFYSDLPAMLSLLALFGLIYAWPHGNSVSHWFMGFGLITIATLGQLLKPNLIVLLPALIIVLALMAFHKHVHWRKLLPLALIVLGFGLSIPAKTLIYQVSNFHADQQFQLPTTSWMLMGVNQHSSGMYSGKDVGHAIKIGNQQKVQAYDLKTIPQRVKKLGPFGLIKLWVVKLGILQRVGGIKNWYNGGFRTAPAWIQNHADFWSQLTRISYQIATITMLLTLIIRLWTWRIDWSDPKDLLVLLAITTTLGIFAFHTLLWEVEERYGQVVLPLLWLSLSGIKQPQREAHAHKAVIPALMAGLAIIGFAGSSLLAHWYPEHQVVAAQRSQLSVQYHAKPHLTQPNTTLKQTITLHGHANYLSVQVHPGSIVEVTLTDATGHVYPMYDAGSVYRLHHQLKPGTYTVTVKNTTHTAQNVDVVKTYNYQLAEHPLIIDGVKHPHASFVFTCIQK